MIDFQNRIGGGGQDWINDQRVDCGLISYYQLNVGRVEYLQVGRNRSSQSINHLQAVVLELPARFGDQNHLFPHQPGLGVLDRQAQDQVTRAGRSFSHLKALLQPYRAVEIPLHQSRPGNGHPGALAGDLTRCHRLHGSPTSPLLQAQF